MRYLRLVFVFIRASFQNDSAYRLNFFMNLLSVILNLAGGLGGIFVLFSANESLNGWSMPETLAVLGVYLLVQALKNLFLNPSLSKLAGLGGELQTGTYDYTLIKPVSKLFYVSVREWSLWSVLHIISGVAVIVIAAVNMGVRLSFLQVILFILSLFISMGILYSLMLLISSVAFWYRGTFVLWLLEDLLQAGRFPIAIYPGTLRLLLTWVFPLAFIVSVPADALAGTLQPVTFMAGFIVMTVLFILAAAFFSISQKKYTGASS